MGGVFMFRHLGNTIYWDAMSWEAFVALVAVLAAGLVGWRQMRVLDRQVDVAALSVKEAVWDRRLVIYDTTKAYLSHIVLKGRVPGRGSALAKVSGRIPAGGDLALAFSQAVDRAQFLMSDATYRRLLDLQAKADRLADIHEDAGIFYEPSKSRLEAEAKDLREFIVGQSASVAAIFGEDLRLSA